MQYAAHFFSKLLPRSGSFRQALSRRDIISQVPGCVDVETQGHNVGRAVTWVETHNAEGKLGSGRMDGKSQPDRSAALRGLPEPTKSSQGQDAGEGIPSSKVFVLVVYRTWLGTSTESRPRRVPLLVCYPSNPRVLICAQVLMGWG